MHSEHRPGANGLCLASLMDGVLVSLPQYIILWLRGPKLIKLPQPSLICLQRHG